MRKEKKLGVIKAKIKRGDVVVFVSGKEYNRYQKSKEGKVERIPYEGKVIAVNPKTRKVKVDGAMIVKKHRKANPQMNVQGGIIKQEAWVDISNIALIDPKTGKPTRVKLEVRDGEKVRVARSGEIIPSPKPFVRVEKTVHGDDVDVSDEPELVKEKVRGSVVEGKVNVEDEETPKKKKSKKADKKADKKKADKSEEE